MNLWMLPALASAGLAMLIAGSVTAIFFNSLWGKPSLFFDAVMSVGRPLEVKSEAA